MSSWEIWSTNLQAAVYNALLLAGMLVLEGPPGDGSSISPSSEQACWITGVSSPSGGSPRCRCWRQWRWGIGGRRLALAGDVRPASPRVSNHGHFHDHALAHQPLLGLSPVRRTLQCRLAGGFPGPGNRPGADRDRRAHPQGECPRQLTGPRRLDCPGPSRRVGRRILVHDEAAGPTARTGSGFR